MEGARNFDAPNTLQIEQNSSQYSNSPASSLVPSQTHSDHSDYFDHSNRMTDTVQTLVTTPEKHNPDTQLPLPTEDDSPARRVSYVPKNNFTLKIPPFSRSNELLAARSYRPQEVKKKKKLFDTEYIPSTRELAKFRPHKFKVVVPRAANQKYEKYVTPSTSQEIQVERKQTKGPLITELMHDLKLKRAKQLEKQLHTEIQASMIETPPPSDYEEPNRITDLQESPNSLERSEFSESERQTPDSHEAGDSGDPSHSQQSKASSDWQKTSTLELQGSLLQHRYHSQTSSSQESSNLFKRRNKRSLRQVEEEEEDEEIKVPFPAHLYGRLDYGDIPKKVLTIYRRDEELMVVVDWERRAHDGFKPYISEVYSDEFKLDFPLKLIEFYESQSRFEKKVVLEGESSSLPMYAMRSRT